MKLRLGLFFSIAMVAMLALAACGGDDNGDGNGNGNGGDGNGNGDGNGGGATSVEMGEFYYDPEQLSGSAGDEMELNFDNAGEQQHDFTIDEWDVSLDLVDPGESDSLTLTVPDDASGEVTFYCTVPGHREQGMEGTFTVE